MDGVKLAIGAIGLLGLAGAVRRRGSRALKDLSYAELKELKVDLQADVHDPAWQGVRTKWLARAIDLQGADLQHPWRQIFEREKEWLTQRFGANVGLNADWSVNAWHLGPGKPANRVSGDTYLLDYEDGAWGLVRRFYVGTGVPQEEALARQAAGADFDEGNDYIEEIEQFSDFEELKEWVRRERPHVARIGR